MKTKTTIFQVNKYTKILKSIIILASIILINKPVYSFNYYWVGGPGNWNDFANHWATTSGGNTFHTQAPDSTNDVYFDANSFSQNASIGFTPFIPNLCHSLNFSGISHPVTFASTSINVFGNLILSSQLVFNSGFNFTLSGSGNCLLKCNGATIPLLTKESSGTLYLADAYQGNNIFIHKGNLNTNSYTVNLGTTGIFSTEHAYRGSGAFNFRSSTVYCDSLLLDLRTGNPGMFTYLYGDSATVHANGFIQCINGSGRFKEIISPSFEADDIFIEHITTSKYIITNHSQVFYFNMIPNSNVAGCGTITGQNNFYVASFRDTTILIKSDITIDSAIFYNCEGLLMDAGKTFFSNYSFEVKNQGASKFNINSADSNSTVYLGLGNHPICVDNTSIQNLHVGGFYAFYAGANSVDGGNNKNVNFTASGTTPHVLYGTNGGNPFNGISGVIFELDLLNGKVNRVHDFNPANNVQGINPNTGLVQAYDSYLYGTTALGIKSLYRFKPLTREYTDMIPQVGSDVNGTMARSKDGKKLYGTNGTGIFEYLVDSNIFRVIYPFTVASGLGGQGTLCVADSGKIYGITAQGAANGLGGIFEFDSDTKMYTILYNFIAADGGLPLCGVIKASNDKLYGSMSIGGTQNKGTLFEFDLKNNSFQKFYDFDIADNKGSRNGELTEAVNGKIYGITTFGGNSNYGTIYEIDTTSHAVNIVANFDSLNFCAHPTGSLLQVSNGHLMGYTYSGGNYHYGTIFEFDPYTHVLQNNYHLSGSYQYPVSRLLEIDPIPTTILSQPQDDDFCIGGTASFQFLINGSGNRTYLWQDSSAQHSWQGIANSNLNALYLFNLKLTDNHTKYRCIITTSMDTVVTQTAQLNLNQSGFRVSLPSYIPDCDNLNQICPSFVGNFPDTYFWNDELTFCRNFLNSGVYVFTAKDIDGCIDTAMTTVGSGSPIILSGVVNNATCGMCDGTVALIATGATAPYLITSATQPPPNLTALCEGDQGHFICTDQHSCVGTFDFIIPAACSNDVWPGDANSDFTANNFDLLNIGLSYGETGPLRTNASLAWVAQPATDWLDTIGVNNKHVDCNGDGIINSSDTLAILLNYGLTHPKLQPHVMTPNAPTLYLQFSIDTAQVGDSLTFAIGLGTAAVPADSVYGIAFSINYENTVVDSASVFARFNSSWFGTKNVDMISLQKDNYTSGKIDIALSGIDHLNRQGYGTIGVLSVDMKDDLSGRDSIFKTLHLSFSNFLLIDVDGNIRPLNSISDSVVVGQDVTAINNISLDENAIILSPNPAKDVVQIDFSNAAGIVSSISIYNAFGQEVLERKIINETKIQVHTSQLSAGIYYVKVKGTRGLVVKKLVVTK
ncbi:MAG: T9SS type A sorting domain-containing protein [Bacteroidetes bacterium]|nr:T9SS type A sorting domain-containing protein [Bacteroidota bacterium]